MILGLIKADGASMSMALARSWKAYRLAYRAREMQTLANWIRAGVSGSVVGLA